MPNWTDKDGTSWFGKLECKRCLQMFASDSYGEVPEHPCHGGIFRSVSVTLGEYHTPMFVRAYRDGDRIYPPKVEKES